MNLINILITQTIKKSADEMSHPAFGGTNRDDYLANPIVLRMSNDRIHLAKKQ